MVKKLVATLHGLVDAWPAVGKPSDNEKLFELLQHYRALIGDSFTNKKWDRNKKLANQYELVYTMFFGYPSLCSYIPISRSFFKLWEIMHDFQEDMSYLSDSQTPIRAMFLAEGPGGFMEAFMRKRHDSLDSIYGMTLISEDNSVPKWKNERLLKDYKGTVTFETGADGTGSLYNIDNIEYLVKRTGSHKCQFITADGGFDFSTDFTNQEKLSQRLIACEIFAALRLQSKNGAFILKIYDIYNPVTFQLLWILKQCYENISIYKPLTSRPANSEKYIVCTHFHSVSKTLLEELREFCIMTVPTAYSLTQPPVSFIQSIVDINHYFVMRQIINITRTIMLIKKDKKEISAFKDVVKEQLKKAIKWCNKYKLPINFQALNEYKGLVMT